MAKRNYDSQRRNRSGEMGLTLVETVIALAVLFIATAGLAGVGVVAIMTTENQGHLAARVAEYAQDKMEQLMSLKYSDGDVDPFVPAQGTDTVTVNAGVNCVQFLNDAACATGGSGLVVGGTSEINCGEPGFAACVDLYVDYLDAEGNPLGGGLVPPADWFYKRVWSITQPAGTSNLKQITVACKTRFVVGSGNPSRAPRAILTMFKSSPF